jgi:hypothetical protein
MLQQQGQGPAVQARRQCVWHPAGLCPRLCLLPSWLQHQALGPAQQPQHQQQGHLQLLQPLVLLQH